MHHVRGVCGREAERETTGPGDSVNTLDKAARLGSARPPVGHNTKHTRGHVNKRQGP